MKLQEIETRPIDSAESPEVTAPTLDERSQIVMEQAEKELGYVPPAPKQDEARPLAKVLKDLLWEEVLDEDSIQRYKAKVLASTRRHAERVRRKMAALATRENFARDFRKLGGYREVAWSNFLYSLCARITLLVVLAGLMFMCIAILILAPFGVRPPLWLWAAVALTLFFSPELWHWRYLLHLRKSSGKIREEVATLDSLGKNNPYIEWREAPLADFDQPVPPPVLANAVEIRRACPDVIFVVHGTVVTKTLCVESVRAEMEEEQAELERARQAQYFDPFLEIRLGSESYFIAVWDEEDYRVTKKEL